MRGVELPASEGGESAKDALVADAVFSRSTVFKESNIASAAEIHTHTTRDYLRAGLPGLRQWLFWSRQ